MIIESEKQKLLNEMGIGGPIVSASFAKDYVSKIKIYTEKKSFQYTDIDDITARMDNDIKGEMKGQEATSMVVTNYIEYDDIIKEIGNRYYYQTEKMPQFTYSKIKYSIRYPFEVNDIFIIMDKLINALSYENRVKKYTPIISVRKSNNTDPIHFYYYITIYLLGFDLDNEFEKYEKISDSELLRKAQYGYTVIINTIIDPINDIKINKNIISAIDMYSKAAYNNHIMKQCNNIVSREVNRYKLPVVSKNDTFPEDLPF